MNNKSKYRQFCSTEKNIPIFSRDWWLDAVAGDENWGVALVEQNNEIVASLPYVYVNHQIIMPKHTQTMGIWMKYPDGQKYHTRLSYEKKICNALIDQLPDYSKYYQRFHFSFTNWLPFYWKGFSQTTRYTYVIEQINDTNSVFDNFSSNLRKNIRKASKLINVYTSDDVEHFYTINKMTFDRQNINMGYSLDYVRSIDQACCNRNCRRIWFAKDKDNHIHSAIYVIWDENSAYYIMGGGDPAFRNSGAHSLLLWEAIKFAGQVSHSFDFEGSMYENIEPVFRGFGAVQKPYMEITRGNYLTCSAFTTFRNTWNKGGIRSKICSKMLR